MVRFKREKIGIDTWSKKKKKTYKCFTINVIGWFVFYFTLTDKKNFFYLSIYFISKNYGKIYVV